jgi:hypothetical protein
MSEVWRREELIILFATLEKLTDVALSLAVPLMAENAEFRTRWLRVQQSRS